MTKPPTIVYGVENAPPLGGTLVSGVQHVVLTAIRLFLPLLVAREAGLAPEGILDVLGVSMLMTQRMSEVAYMSPGDRNHLNRRWRR